MSPANHSEHSRVDRQRTGSRNKCAGNVSPVILQPVTLNTDSDLQLAKTEISPAKHSEHSGKHR